MGTKFLRAKQAAYAFRVRELTDDERKELFYRERDRERRQAEQTAMKAKMSKPKHKRRRMKVKGHSRSFAGLNFSRVSRIPR
jgi:hypothetical protein